MGHNEAMAALWNSEATSAWVTRAERYEGMLAGLGHLALDAAALQPGEQVLDVGCGAGQLSSEAAALVGPDGAVTGVDLSGPMIELARRRFPDVEFLQADAQTHALPADRFDAVISRFGVMFFDDPVAAFENLRAATAPGGRLAFVAWQSLADNEWAMVPAFAVIPHVGMPEVPGPGEPGPFAFEDPHRIRSILEGAGWSDVAVDGVSTSVLVAGGGTVDEAVEFFRDDAFARALLAAAEPDAAAGAEAALREAFEPHRTHEGVRMAAAVWVVTARC